MWTTSVFEVSTWVGDLGQEDPDGLVVETVFLPTDEAPRRIEDHPIRVMREPMLAYLRKEEQSQSLWVYRRDQSGDDTMLVTLPIGQ